MTKKLSELYAPKSKDEKAFVAKHTIKKTTDKSPATKDDARFTGSNVKTFDRSKHRMGYDAGGDQKAYDNGNNPGPNDMKNATALAPYTVKIGEEEEIELTDEDIDELIDMLGEIVMSEAKEETPYFTKKSMETISKQPAGSQYNKDSVNKAIASSKPKISGKEAKMIHGLLKGWRGK